jgi:hypothetical protein
VSTRSLRYFALALTLVALTATVRPAHALTDDDPCTDPTTGCIVGNGDPKPPPSGNVVTHDPNALTLPDDNGTAGSGSMDKLIPYLVALSGLS